MPTHVSSTPKSRILKCDGYIPIAPQNAIFCRVLFVPRARLKLANRVAITCVLNDPWEQKSPRHKSRILRCDGYSPRSDYFQTDHRIYPSKRLINLKSRHMLAFIVFIFEKYANLTIITPKNMQT